MATRLPSGLLALATALFFWVLAEFPVALPQPFRLRRGGDLFRNVLAAAIAGLRNPGSLGLRPRLMRPSRGRLVVRLARPAAPPDIAHGVRS